MAIEFNFYRETVDVFIDDNLVGEIDFSVPKNVVFNQSSIEDVEQILSKMKELQGEKV